jgi:acyl-CoA reductase-like NAD-dependent aldehyde dehydrogenase
MDILNYINGECIKPNVKGYFGVINPVTGQVIAQTPLCNAEAVDAAARAASSACQQYG